MNNKFSTAYIIPGIRNLEYSRECLYDTLDSICKHFDVDINDILNRPKHKNSYKLVQPVKLFCYVAIKDGFTYMSLARFLNNNHANIMHHFKTFEHDYKLNYKEFKNKCSNWLKIHRHEYLVELHKVKKC